MERVQEQHGAIEQFVDRLKSLPRILAGHNRRLGRPLDEHDLADLSQDAAVVLLQKRHLFAEGVPYEAWVYRVCAMEIRNGVRRKLRRSRAATVLAAEVEPSGDRATGDVFVRRQLVRDMMARLEPEEAALVRMKHFEGLTFDEISGRLALASSTLKTRYYRARSRLQVLLASAQRD